MGDELSEAQREYWQRTYEDNPGMYGTEASAPALAATELFRSVGAQTILELGAGHGRDTLHFARCGFTVQATDFSPSGLEQLTATAVAEGLADRVDATIHDIREPIPLPDQSVDAVFAHMLLCIALSTEHIHAAVDEVRRVLRPGGLLVYTVRNTTDAHYGAGIAHGDDIYEHGGFAVHYFTRALVDDLATGWTLTDLHPFDEGDLPRRLWRVTQQRPT